MRPPVAAGSCSVMATHSRLLHVERKPPKSERGVSLSELCAAADARGLVLSFAQKIEIRDGERVLHQPSSLADARAWLDCRA